MEDDALHAGAILRHKRTELGLSISDISRRTGIRVPILEAIEAGAFDTLPMVYMRSFVRRYARAVGINEHDLPPLEEAHAAHHAASTLYQSVHSSPASQRLRRVPPAVGALLAVVIVGAAGYALFLSAESTAPPQPTTPAAEVPIETVRTAPTRGLLDYFGDTGGDSLRLEAVASDTAWLSITMDGRRTEQLTLRPGDRRQWSARQQFVISIGNAGGVELYRNGQQLPPLGKRGEAVRYVRITASDLIPSTSSWSRRRDSLLETLTRTPQTSSTTPPPQASNPRSLQSRSSQITTQPAPKPTTATTPDRRRQEILRRAMQSSREITPVAPKAPLPTPQKPSSP